MTMLFAMAAAPLLDWMFNGSPNITLDPQRRLEGTELEGWNIKGPPSYRDPPGVAEGETGNNLVFGSEAKSVNKLHNQMNSRGWSRETVQSTYSGPFITRPSTNVATGNPATAYFNKDGSYVVIDDITHEVVQVSDRFDPNWIPDPNITNPYLP